MIDWRTEPWPDEMTSGEKYNPAMALTTQAEADLYFARLVERTMRVRPELTREEAEQLERANLGYWTGYHSHETAERVERLFNACHPVLGPVEWRRQYTADEILAMGYERGKLGSDADRKD